MGSKRNVAVSLHASLGGQKDAKALTHSVHSGGDALLMQDVNTSPRVYQGLAQLVGKLTTTLNSVAVTPAVVVVLEDSKADMEPKL